MCSYGYAGMQDPRRVKNCEAQFSSVPADGDLGEVNVVWAATNGPADGKDGKEARSTIDGIFKDGIAGIEKMLGDKTGDDDDDKDND